MIRRPFVPPGDLFSPAVTKAQIEVNSISEAIRLRKVVLSWPNSVTAKESYLKDLDLILNGVLESRDEILAEVVRLRSENKRLSLDVQSKDRSLYSQKDTFLEREQELKDRIKELSDSLNDTRPTPQRRGCGTIAILFGIFLSVLSYYTLSHVIS